jgi:methylenetetrahydrofolate dehydrogenase (NAD+)
VCVCVCVCLCVCASAQPAEPAAGQRVDAAEVAAPYRALVREVIQTRLGGRGPLLVGILANDDPAAVKYADWTRRACEADGIRYELRRVARTDVEDALSAANADPAVHGILIYYPVFGASALPLPGAP